jgi:hypothetical protein
MPDTAGAFSSPQFFIKVTLYPQPVSTQFLWHAFCDKLCGRTVFASEPMSRALIVVLRHVLVLWQKNDINHVKAQ